MRARLVLLAVVLTAVTILPGVATASDRHPIPGAPVGTPRWLAELTRQKASAFGDPDPERIVVRLGIVDRYGRRLDRVWMRGDFACANCTTGLASTAWRGHVMGFTVLADTHRLLSFSLHPG